MIKLHQLESLPDVVMECPATELFAHFPSPTLIHLKGRRDEPLFVSILLHGNETTGLLAIQKILKKYRDTDLPRSLSLFLGNLEAASLQVRRLSGQVDYNRVWPGTEYPPCPESKTMDLIVDIMRERRVFASLDLHNNTGLNPHYACLNVLENEHLQLATLFGRTVVHFIRPTGTQSAAMAPICPAVTLECGKPGEPHGVDHAVEFLDACLHLSSVPETPVADHDIDLFHTVAQVKIPQGLEFSFDSNPSDLNFVSNLERLNFQEMPQGTIFAHCPTQRPIKLEVTDEQGNDVADKYFACSHNHLKLRREVMPSMLTLDKQVIRQDCLCYLMERMPQDVLR
jgi:succinylglutamate desuccinylase